MTKLKNFFFSAFPFICIILIVLGLYGLFVWKSNQATYLTFENLTYERAEPERDWLSHDYVIFVTEDGNKIKYLAPEHIYKTMEYGSKYTITVIDGDIVTPSMKVKSAIPYIE